MEKRKAAEYVVEPLQIQQQMKKAKDCAKILEEINEESKEKLSNNILQAEDGNVPLQEQKRYEFSKLVNKLASQSSTYHSLLVYNL